MNKTSYVFKDDGTYPNNILPLVLLKQAIQSMEPISPSTIEKVFHENNWVSSWRNGLFGFHHYHSTAHEVLGIYSGWVKAQLGGPDGKTVIVEVGDVVIIPAGVAHKNIDQSPDFNVVGAYPIGQVPDMKYGKPGERPNADQNIQNIDRPEYDPVYGKAGPLMELWS
ncbi:hypothetical protein DO021_15330 [Desulfobacter hydrogenophilus]|uniref:Cupin type-1 domain-containing protein n=1 Tax=Desulfobacter hydrogenophilus TaxID=2291 RepID=A0A328F992_9BACT|nr:hypothetical protein [Desulfobacter hydrogenophilus]NDY72870.1 hypothetical protein [Desulfobacter hydrogenophilus]QBH13597.1 hypothetical protein EYB58_12075 [Desulfobacter hydrogenophilus]RAM01178.1 hypothetical protein DO021_15330 [Desulfobacter hydrogenophilus]